LGSIVDDFGFGVGELVIYQVCDRVDFGGEFRLEGGDFFGGLVFIPDAIGD
jgi:hypothetical protein